MAAAQPTRQRQQRHRAACCRIGGGVRWRQLSPPDRGSSDTVPPAAGSEAGSDGSSSAHQTEAADTVPPAVGSEAGSDGSSSAHQTEAAETPCRPLQDQRRG